MINELQWRAAATEAQSIIASCFTEAHAAHGCLFRLPLLLLSPISSPRTAAKTYCGYHMPSTPRYYFYMSMVPTLRASESIVDLLRLRVPFGFPHLLQLLLR